MNKEQWFNVLMLSIIAFCFIAIFNDSYQHLSFYKNQSRKVEVINTSVKGNIVELTSIKTVTFKYNKEIYNLDVNLQDYYNAKYSKFIELTFSDYDICDNKLNDIINYYLMPIAFIILTILALSYKKIE